MTKTYDDRTNVYYQTINENGKETVILNLDDYNEIAKAYKHMSNRLYRYQITHAVAHDLTRIMVIVRITLAIMLGLFLPILFNSPGIAFDMFYGMLFLALVLSIFVPDGETDTAELVDSFMGKKK